MKPEPQKNNRTKTADVVNKEFLTYLSKFPELPEKDRLAIAGAIPVEWLKKGTILLKEGEISRTCYFVLKGCVRQYHMVDGEERTTAFFTEEQAVVSFTSYTTQTPCDHYFACVEDSLLMIGEASREKQMYENFPQLEVITRKMMQQDHGKTQDTLSSFITSSPEERYLQLLKTRGDLFQRVPQHQLASYLGIAPESLSRLRRRLSRKKKP